jgi:uncharacterized repeat protein (TIGR01451 family)
MKETMKKSIHPARQKNAHLISMSKRRQGRLFPWLASLISGLALILLGIPSSFADQDPAGCDGSGLGILLFTSASDVHIGDTLTYSVTVFNGTSTGPIVCDATSVTATLVTPDGVSHAIPLTVTNLVSGESDYYPNVVSYVVRAQDIQPDGTVDATASDSGVIHQNTVNSMGGGHQGVNTIVSQPCIKISAQCTNGIGETALINFTGTVTNCGNDVLYDVGVTNMVNGTAVQVAYFSSIGTNSAATFSGSYSPASPCTPSVATITASGTDSATTYPQTIQSSTTLSCTEVLIPGIVVTKTCPATPGAPGQLITYTGSVSNSGNVTLDNVVVVDNQPVPNTQVYTVPSLAPGAVQYFNASFTAPSNTCSVSDILTGSGTSTCGVAVNNSVNSTCPLVTTPAIAVTVACPATPILPGGTLTYSGTVVNSGNITLTNVAVYSDVPVANTLVFRAVSLAPNGSTNFSGSYVVPANTCALTTILTATGNGACGLSPVTNTATTSCPVTTSPAITVSLACPATTAPAGGLITYSGTVRNSGNVILDNVYVMNSSGAPAYGPVTLAVGASTNFSYSFIAPSDSCSVSSAVTANGNDNCTGNLVSNTATATCPLGTAPAIFITQNCSGSAAPGFPLTYSGTVSNAGNSTLTNVVVVNNLSGSTPLLALASLSPGATAIYSGSYTAPAACSSTSTSTVTAKSTCGIAVTASSSSTCPITTTPALGITENCPATSTAPGATLTYTGTVTNSGNISLTNVMVVNAMNPSVVIYRATTLGVGAGASFSGSYVTPTNCSSVSVVTASGESICGQTISSSASATCPIVTTPMLKITQNCPTLPATPGALLTFSGSITNDGNISVTNVVVSNDQAGIIFTVATLAPHTGSNYTGSYLAPSACSSTSTSTATATSTCGVTVSTNISTTCAISTSPSLTINQSCSGEPVIPGGSINYSGSISNAGNVTVSNVVVMNNLSGSIFTAPSLAPGASATYNGSYVAPSACSSTSTSTVSGISICGVTTSASSTTTCPVLTTPVLSVTENCPATPTVPGAVLTYSGTVTNAGDIALTNVIVVNTQNPAVVIYRAATLGIGAGASFTGSYVTPTNCSSTTILTASAASICGVTVTNAASATCTIDTTPALKITQSCSGTPVAPGALLTFSGTVTNTGNITVNNVTVVNNQSGVVFTSASLAPGQGASYSGNYLAPTNCSSTSTSTVTALSSCGVGVTNTASTTCTVITTPSIAITESCPSSPAIPGGLLTYSGSVSNSGNITLTNVVVRNNENSSTPVFTIAVLLPSEVTNFTASYVAPTNCSSTSISTVTAGSICGVTVSSSATATCPILTTPAISVITYCPANGVPPGGILTYSGSVSNTGNITLTNVVVTSDLPAANTTVYTVATLAPGASANFTGSYQVPLNCCVVFSTVTVTGQSCAGQPVSDEYTRTCTVLTAPSIVVTKVCPGTVLQPGGLLTYSGSVSNSGNITLVSVNVTDDEAPGIPVFSTPIDLAPGQSVNFTASYTVPPNFCGSDTVTATGLDVCNYLPVTDSVNSTCPITTSPAIAVSLNCPLLPTPRGGLYTYNGSVSNAGDVSLVNVYVTNDEPSNHTPVLGPITLAPGASMPFTNSYVAPTCCCLIIDTVTATGQNFCNSSNVSATDTSVCPLLTTPSLTLVETCPASPIPMGSTFDFSGYVTNTGDVVLTNVVVYGPLGTNNPVLGPVSLAPGQSQPYSGAYTTVFNSSNVVITTTGQETCAGTTASNSVICIVVPTPQIADPTNGTTKVSFPTADGGTYTVQYKNNITDPTWTNLQAVTGTGAVVFVTDTTTAGYPTRFYRVVVAP